jgi:VWFA-related protein
MKISPSFLFRGRNRRCFAPGTAERLPATRAGGLTPLFDTVVLASEYLLQHGDAKAEKILIVFSDGADTISRSSLANAVDAALMNDVRVFWIDLNSSLSQGAGVLYRMADATGGRYFSARDGVGRALNIILEGFRATYTVSYRLPSHASGFHTVQVLPTHNLGLQLRSRSGHYYPNHVR